MNHGFSTASLMVRTCLPSLSGLLASAVALTLLSDFLPAPAPLVVATHAAIARTTKAIRVMVFLPDNRRQWHSFSSIIVLEMRKIDPAGNRESRLRTLVQV